MIVINSNHNRLAKIVQQNVSFILSRKSKLLKAITELFIMILMHYLL